MGSGIKQVTSIVVTTDMGSGIKQVTSIVVTTDMGKFLY